MIKKLAPFFFFSSLIANPSGEHVVRGDCKIERNGNEMHVRQLSNSAIIDWDQFSILTPESTHFEQPSSRSAILNKVVGSSISEIHGKLTSNGLLYLINENGIAIGPSGKIDTKGGFIASTMALSSGQNLEENLQFIKTKDSQIDFEGEILAKNGPVYLISPKIFEKGKIDAASVHLLAGSEVFISHPMGGSIKVTSFDAQGSIDDFAIQQEGIVHASGYKEENGQIILWSEKDLAVSGCLHAEKIVLEGREIAIQNPAYIDTSSEFHGGEISIGGVCKNLDVEAGALIVADAISSGNGGKITLFAENTAFHGAISSQALGSFGDGGDVEISASHNLTITGYTDLRSKFGNFGTLLCDPGSVTINNGVGVGPNSFGDPFIIAQLALGNLTISTFGGTNAAAETLTFSGGGGAANISWAQNTTFTAIGRRNVIISSGVTIENTGSGSISLQGLANASGTYAGVSITGATLSVLGGNLSITGFGGDTGNQNFGVDMTTSSIASTSGGITIQGNAGGSGAANTNIGVRLRSTSSITTASGAIQITANGGLGSPTSHGMDITVDSHILSQVSGDIIIHAAGGPTSQVGLRMAGSSMTHITSAGSGDITIFGTGGGGGSNDSAGVFLVGQVPSGCRIVSNNGNIFIQGTGTGTSTNNHGIHLLGAGLGNPAILTTGVGTITLVGTGSGTDGVGVLVGDGFATVATSNPAASISITGTGSNEQGITVSSASFVGGPTTTAPITLTADTMTISGTVQGTSTLLVQPLNPGTSVGIGTLEPGTLNLTNLELANLLSFSSQTFGPPAGTGVTTTGGLTLTRPTTFQNQSVVLDNPLTINNFNANFSIGGIGVGEFHLQSSVISTGGTAQVVGAGPADSMSFFEEINATNTWNINGLNSGVLNSGAGFSVSFSNVGNLIGGNQNDQFVFANQQGVSGYIDGGAPPFFNTLEYPGWNPPAIVQFLGPFDGLASNITQGFFNIFQVTGNFIDPPVPNIPATFSTQISLSFLYLFLYGKDDDLFSLFQYYLLAKAIDPRNWYWTQIFADVVYQTLPNGLNRPHPFHIEQEIPDPFVRPHFSSFTE